MSKAKHYVIFLLVSLCMFVMVMPGMAASITQDGLDISLTTNKLTYISGENIHVELTIINTNSITVNGIQIQHKVPNGYKLSLGDLFKKVNSLGPKEKFTMALTYTPTILPKTGDNSGIFLWLSLFVVSGVILCAFKNKGKAFMALLLCVVLMHFSTRIGKRFVKDFFILQKQIIGPE